VTKSPFEELFEFVATSDDSAYLCVPAALKFREEVCGGEDAIISYCEHLANEAADAVSTALGTDVLQEPDLKPGEISNMRRCTMTTVRLPLAIAIASGEEKVEQPEPLATFSAEDAVLVEGWMKRTLMDQYKTFVPAFANGPWLWVRLSAQVYLEKSDFEWLGGVLRDLCERAAKGEYRN
jgi:selenocysteine lyase/cysteine desulfurase